MSSTNRGGKRSPADTYCTPLWCVHRALEAIPLPDGLWVDPCAGTGNIIQGVLMLRPETKFKAYELRPECMEPLVNIGANPIIVDFTSERSMATVVLSPSKTRTVIARHRTSG